MKSFSELVRSSEDTTYRVAATLIASTSTKEPMRSSLEVKNSDYSTNKREKHHSHHKHKHHDKEKRRHSESDRKKEKVHAIKISIPKDRIKLDANLNLPVL